MRWVPIVFLVFQVQSVPNNQKKSKIYMASIDLDSSRKHQDPEVVPDIGSQLPTVKRNATIAPDYFGDYEDYELTAKSDVTTTSTATSRPEPIIIDSQFNPHLKISMKTVPKPSDDVRDEVSRLMGDLHREELTIRTTVTKQDMTTSTMDPVLGNMSMFFDENEGSGTEFSEDELLNLTISTTTRKPLLFTTVIQEVKSVPVTVRPDPFENLDYDLTDHSNLPKTKKKKKVDRLKKYKSQSLHGGAVDKPGINSTIASVIVIPKRRKTLRKLKKIDKLRKVKSLNHRLRAQNKMRLRKVFSKMIFRSRDRVATGHRSTKLKFVGSNGVVTPAPFKIDAAKKLDSIDGKTKRSRRDKRAILGTHLQVLDSEVIEPEPTPIESTILKTIGEEPHPAYHLVRRTQVEPSPMVNEAQEENEDYVEENSKKQEPLPIRSGLVQVSLEENSVKVAAPRKLKMVPLKKLKKIHRHESMDGGVLAAPTASKPTMLELLIGDFLGRLPPTARSPSFSQEQWS